MLRQLMKLQDDFKSLPKTKAGRAGFIADVRTLGIGRVLLGEHLLK